jgi:hypothetical protein
MKTTLIQIAGAFAVLYLVQPGRPLATFVSQLTFTR